MAPIGSEARELFTTLARHDAPRRPPASFWRHFYTEENDSKRLASAHLGFHKQFGWDWIKVNPRGSYHLEDWGFLYEPSTHPLQKPVKKHFPVQKAGDWERITPKPATSGALGEHLDLVARVVKGAQGDPVLMTVFSPLSIAGDLVPDDGMLLRHLREEPERVAQALSAITETFEQFVAELLNAGADGIFFATTQWASKTKLSAASYEAWGRPYDLRVLKAAGGAPFNLLHVCEAESLLAELADYPVQLFNWGFADPGNPDLEAGQQALDKPVIGGVARKDLLEGTPEQIFRHISDLCARMSGRSWGLGPDCSIEPGTPEENLVAARRAGAEFQSKGGRSA